MKILFVHQNFPGQYLHLARHLGASGEHEVVFITQRNEASLPGVKKIIYKPQRKVAREVHHYLRGVEEGVLNAQMVARIALDLKQSGFVPDVMFGHNGWGEPWYLKDVFRHTPLIVYFEFFYQRYGADVGFNPSDTVSFDDGPRIRSKNMGNLLGLEAADFGQCPTRWQQSLYPSVYQAKLHVTHEGIDTRQIKPDPLARFDLPEKNISLSRKDEVLTFVARNLEPYRGFPQFMRSLPQILAQRPQAQVLVVGGDESSYGPGPGAGKTWREVMLAQLTIGLADGFVNPHDLNRIHFLGRVPYRTFLQILQISRAHVYLSYPFVLSWSMLEAMAAGCVVIGSDTAPVKEVILHGENGLLVDFFSTSALAEQVIAVLENPSAFQAMRQQARQTIVEKYDLHTICLPQQRVLLQQAVQAP